MRTTYLFLAILLLAIPVAAQTVDLDKDRLPVAPLPDHWRFHAGDNPAWAEAGFDDSGWSLLRSDRSWAEQGFKGYGGMGWYRFQVIVPARLEHVSITLPVILDSFDLYADSVRIGSYGRMPPKPAKYVGGYVNELYSLPLTRSVSANGEHRIIVALRVWFGSQSGAQGGGPVDGANGVYCGAASTIEQCYALSFGGAGVWPGR